MMDGSHIAFNGEKGDYRIGAQKIVLGSDTPYGKDNLRLNLKQVKALPISDEEKDLILGRNLHNLLN